MQSVDIVFKFNRFIDVNNLETVVARLFTLVL